MVKQSMALEGLKVKLFQDGPRLDGMVAAKRAGIVAGFTTNPTLMRKAGVTIAAIPDVPISFELFPSTSTMMEKEANEIASWDGNTY
jgi:transaldolase